MHTFIHENVSFIHNPDLSGDMEIIVHKDERGVEVSVIEIPGKAMQDFMAHIIRQQLYDELDNMGFAEITKLLRGWSRK